MIFVDSFFERLIQELDNRKHLNALFPNRPIMIKFVCDKEEWGLYISKNSCSIMKKDIGESNLEIHASKPILCHLLNGHIRLSQLVKNNELTLYGSYRLSLLLESILWLSRDYQIA